MTLKKKSKKKTPSLDVQRQHALMNASELLGNVLNDVASDLVAKPAENSIDYSLHKHLSERLDGSYNDLVDSFLLCTLYVRIFGNRLTAFSGEKFVANLNTKFEIVIDEIVKEQANNDLAQACGVLLSDDTDDGMDEVYDLTHKEAYDMAKNYVLYLASAITAMTQPIIGTHFSHKVSPADVTLVWTGTEPQFTDGERFVGFDEDGW